MNKNQRNKRGAWLGATSMFFILAGTGLLGLLLLLQSDYGINPARHMGTSTNSAKRSPQSNTEEWQKPPTSYAVASRLDSVEVVDNLSATRDRSESLHDRDKIEDEFTISFASDDDLKRFLELAESKDIVVLDTIDVWNSVRVRIEDPNKLHDLLAESPTPSNYSPNYFIRAPDIPPSPDNSPQILPTDLQAFGNMALKWLGLEKNSSIRGEGTLIAVLDTGVHDHPTFSGKAIEHISVLDESGSKEGDFSGHGTAVASIISGRSSDAPGVAPDAEILSVQVLDDNGVGDTFTLAKGIVEAVDYGPPDVINMSLGSYGDSPELRRAVKYALDHDVAIVASAGNDGIDRVTYPAGYDGVLAVTGIDPTEHHVPFGNHGTEELLAAPAVGIQSAWSDEGLIHFSGTSAAAPFVSGTLAMLRSENPDLSASETIDIVTSYANDSGAPGPDPVFGDGILDIGRIQNRNKAGIQDIALAGHHIDSQDTDLVLVVSGQNRGTEVASKIQMTVTVDNGVKETIEFDNVSVGETVSAEFQLDKEKLFASEPIEIRSSVTLDTARESKVENNSKSSILFYEAPLSN